MTLAPQAAHAQGVPILNACSGVRLERSVVTNIMGPVVTGSISPLETRLNQVLGIVASIPLVGVLLPSVNTNVSGLLTTAASGAPITLQAVDTNGNLIGPSDQCNLRADSLSLGTESGIAIGGNRIDGLGSNGRDAFSGNMDGIAFGNGARVEVGATSSVALGADAQATAANSVALGSGATAARGPQLGYAALAIAGPQNSAGEVSIGSAGAERQITNLAAGSAPTDAVNVAQLQGVSDQVGTLASNLTALQADAVSYDGPGHDRISLDGAGGTVIDNVADGQLAAGSREAVNGGQLFATNQIVAGNSAAIATTSGRVDTLELRVDANALAITDIYGQISVLGSGGGAAPGPVRYSDAGGTANAGATTQDATLVGAAPGAVGLHNVANGSIAAGSNDAVNGSQLNDTNQNVAALTTQVAANGVAIADIDARVTTNSGDISNLTSQTATNTLAITNLTTLIGTLGPGGTVTANPVQYADAATPTVPNGGTVSNDVTLVGAGGAAVALHNVASGNVSATSTDAVNGSQLHATNVELAVVHSEADEALALGRNSAQYSADGSLTLGNGATPVSIHNVAAGVAPTDAVNVGQLAAGMQSAVGQANAYTDLRIDNIVRNTSTMRRNLNGGIAGALAASGMPQVSDPGRSMVAMGVATYQGEQAFAFGLSSRLPDAQTVFRLGVIVDTRGRAAANGGVGYQF